MKATVPVHPTRAAVFATAPIPFLLGPAAVLATAPIPFLLGPAAVFATTPTPVLVAPAAVMTTAPIPFLVGPAALLALLPIPALVAPAFRHTSRIENGDKSNDNGPKNAVMHDCLPFLDLLVVPLLRLLSQMRLLNEVLRLAAFEFKFVSTNRRSY